jgi:hypothetical protein
VNPQSAKAKGRRLQQAGRDKYLAAFPSLEPDDITSRSMGASGTDLLLSPAAKRLIPFDHEFKNVERLNFWDSVEQAEKNTAAGRQPMLVTHRNGSEMYATIRFDYLLKMLKQSTVRFDGE